MSDVPPTGRPKRIAWSFVLTAALWVCFTWPLPRHVTRGIPCASENAEAGAARTMIAGDHLQLFYYFWLGGEMLQGHVPPFLDIYQFNVGADKDRFVPSAFFFPFCLVFAVVSKLGSTALAYNAAGFLALWMSLLAAWILARRYTHSDAAAASGALLGFVLPFRWTALLGGSPTGLAMMWLPCLFLGLDIAIRDARAAGGWLAALSLVMVYAADLQTSFMAALFTPLWCLTAFCMARRLHRPDLRAWLALLRAVAPLAAGVAAMGFFGWLRHHNTISKSGMSGGRSWHELALFSPRDWHGFFYWLPQPGSEHHLYVGWAIPAVLAAGLAALLIRTIRRPRESLPLAVTAFVLASICVGLCMLAMGAYGPWGGLPVRACRRFVPYYTMIRQSTKILSFLPSAVAVLGAIAFGALAASRRGGFSRAVNAGALALILLAAVVPPLSHVRATVSLLDTDQPAYRAVAQDAARRGRELRCMIVPLWPGDSAWSSVYQYYATLFRIRMVNGYRPAVNRAYISNVFDRFQGINQGHLASEDIEGIRRMGVDYVMLHENIFPEKVSPVAAGYTLRRLLEHPRLELLAEHKGVWAFRIADEPRDKPPALSGCAFFMPTRRLEAEEKAGERARTIQDPGCGNGAFVRMEDTETSLDIDLDLRGPRTACLPGFRWLVRARGAGELAALARVDDATNRVERLAIAQPDWSWFEVPTGPYDGVRRVSLRLDLVAGQADVDTALLVAGDLPSFNPGVPAEVPAAALFHWCATDTNTEALVLRAERDQSHPLRGPSIPMPAGAYRVEMIFDSPAAAGTPLGSFVVTDGIRSSADCAVVAGRPAVCPYEQRGNLPLNVEFTFSRRADMAVSRLVFTRQAQ